MRLRGSHAHAPRLARKRSARRRRESGRPLGRDLGSARRALDALDIAALAAIGVEPGITAGPVAVRTRGRLRLTPAAKAIFTGIHDARKNRSAGLGIVLGALLDLPRPDPAAELLAALDVDARAARERFSDLGQEGQP